MKVELKADGIITLKYTLSLSRIKKINNRLIRNVRFQITSDPTEKEKTV
jgi:hypothetical protein